MGRPPQDLMSGWGRRPICKASKPDHRLGIRATCNIYEEGKKGSVVGRGRPVKSAEMRVEALGFKEGWKAKKWIMIIENRDWARRRRVTFALNFVELEVRDWISKHRGLSSGVASDKFIGSDWAYGWVEMHTPFSSHITPYGSDKCFHALCFELEIMDACLFL